MLIDARPGRPDHVYLSDFGLAKGGSASALTGTGLYLGTVAYMAPEQIQGQGVDGRADQYALGCAAFELLGGEVPFERDQDMAVIYAHLSVPPPSLASKRPGLPPAVDGALARALAKAPEDRYPSCREFAEALRQALGLPGYDRGPGVAVARAAASGQGPDAPAAAESGATEFRPVTGGDRGVPEPGRSGLGEEGGTRELPQGTVTFLFTDLEGSTRRWEAHPAQMREALARHNTIVRGAVESHGGVVFSTMGDGLAAVFASAREAVRAVLAAQQGLGAEDWGEVTGPLAARMGLLTDEGVLGGEHYLNQPLNRCARLMAAGHGGQALVSGATELLVRDDLPDGCALVDLGEHRLRDLARPVRIFQLTGPGLRREFPPLRTLEAFAGNLPVQLSSFVGRAGELGQAGRGDAAVAAGDGDRAGRGRQDPAGAAGRGGPAAVLRATARGCASCTRPTTRRRWRRPSWPRCGRARGPACPRPTASWSSCGPGPRCCWCWITASTWRARRRRWPRTSCAAARGCASWPPASSRWAWAGSRCSGCGRCRCRPRRRAWRPPAPATRCPCSPSGPPPRAATSR